MDFCDNLCITSAGQREGYHWVVGISFPGVMYRLDVDVVGEMRQHVGELVHSVYCISATLIRFTERLVTVTQEKLGAFRL